MTIEIQGAKGMGSESARLFPHNLDIPPATALMGGACFPSAAQGRVPLWDVIAIAGFIGTGVSVVPSSESAPGGDLDNVRALLLSETDWDFLATALQGPPTVNAAIQRLLTESSVLDR